MIMIICWNEKFILKIYYLKILEGLLCITNYIVLGIRWTITGFYYISIIKRIRRLVCRYIILWRFYLSVLKLPNKPFRRFYISNLFIFYFISLLWKGNACKNFKLYQLFRRKNCFLEIRENVPICFIFLIETY